LRYAAAVLLASLASCGVASAQQPTCKLQAAEKRLADPVLKTFMQKCEEDAQKLCQQLASTRLLEEPGRAIFLANCVKHFRGD
jgi:hypothetical protein